MQLIPNSYGSLREFNDCHAPNSGQFCSGAGAGRQKTPVYEPDFGGGSKFDWSTVIPSPYETKEDRSKRYRLSNSFDLPKLVVLKQQWDPDDRTTLHQIHYEHGSIHLVHDSGAGGVANRLVVQQISVDKDRRGKGDGQKLLLAARDYAKYLGLKGIVSYKTERSPDADRAWDGLRRKGHVTRRVPATKRLISGYKSTELELFESKWRRRVVRENQADIMKRFAITELDFPTPDSEIRHIGYSPTHKKWYGWSHRAVFGFKVGDRVKQGDVIANTDDYAGPLALPVGFEAKTVADTKRMAAAFAMAVS